MTPEPSQDSGTYRIKRKPPPPFQFSSRYPEPDPNDPFAPLSVLRDRTTTLTNSAYESPITDIQDPALGASKVHDLATFLILQRKKAAASGNQFGDIPPAFQLRKGASLGFHESPSSEIPTTTATTLRPGARDSRRRESRRRSQSVFARSRTFSFLESRRALELEPRPNVDSLVSSRRHSLLPSRYDSSSSVLTSSSTSSSGESTNGSRQANKASMRPRSCSSSFVTAALLDGVPEFSSDAILVQKSMHVMQVDMPAPRVPEEGSERAPSRIISPPPPLEQRSPSESSIGSWSRDLAFYSASSRPQTPSSIQSSRPTSPPAPVAIPPFAPVALPSGSPPLFTAGAPPHISSTHQHVPTVAIFLPSSISKLRRVSTPPEDFDTRPLHLNFPKQQRYVVDVESEPESVERENERFTRSRALTTGSQGISASSSLRSTLQAAADAAERLALEASLHALPSAPIPTVTQAQPMVAENLVTSPVADTAPELKEREVEQRAQLQPGSQGHVSGQQSRVSPPAYALSHQNANNVPPAARNQSIPSARPAPPKPILKPESEAATTPKHRSLSRSSQRYFARRSTSTPLPISRPLPSPPAVTTPANLEQVAKSPPTPPPRAHGHGMPSTQVQHASPAPSPPIHGAPSSHVVQAPSSVSSLTGLPAGAAPPRPPCAPAAHPFPLSHFSNLPPPPPPPRAAYTVPLPSRMAHGSASSVVQSASASSSSSQVDYLSTASAPQMRRRDDSPSSSSHGRHSPHISERHGHHHHHPYHHGMHPRSLSEPGASGALSSTQLAHAARLPVVRENGVRVQFGELWRAQRTVVIFIRHFWYARICIFLILLSLNTLHHAGVRYVRTTSHRSCAMQTTPRFCVPACVSS
jgi:hypothetical protein